MLIVSGGRVDRCRLCINIFMSLYKTSEDARYVSCVG
jgi:hypothetical protein